MSGIESKVRQFQFVSVLSLIFALLGFSYNAWRLEVSESNNNLRVASFQVLLELAELERVVFASHYDKDDKLGNPRTGWIKVGLISDLTMLLNQDAHNSAAELRLVWEEHWAKMKEERESTDRIIAGIDSVRVEVRNILAELD